MTGNIRTVTFAFHACYLRCVKQEGTKSRIGNRVNGNVCSFHQFQFLSALSADTAYNGKVPRWQSVLLGAIILDWFEAILKGARCPPVSYTLSMVLLKNSSIGQYVGWALLISAALIGCRPALAQISPGPLTKSHQNLEGMTKCSSCHDFGAGSRGFRCLECHQEIKQRLDTHSGFHSRAFKASTGEADCARCHAEHNGRTFQLIRQDRQSFNHAEQTGFALQGKHRELKCETCHNEKKMNPVVRKVIRLTDANRSFLGLGRDCLSCHEDHHQGQLGTDCTKCHSLTAWKPLPGFNHTQTSFPLTGLHQKVMCEECHGPHPGQATVRLKGLATTCNSCHSDPHRGAFRQVTGSATRDSCETCHTTGGWKNNHPGNGFEHPVNQFALKGKHLQLSCDKCHKTTDFSKPIPHDRCGDCHEDPHKSQFARRTPGSDCSSCHVEIGFSPSLFNTDLHRSAPFPLEGKHLTVECSRCHTGIGKDTNFVGTGQTCSSCHPDSHAGEFASGKYTNQCNLCHTTGGFEQTTFSALRHAQTTFVISGAHAAVTCDECHKPLDQPTVTSVWLKEFLNPPRQHHFESQNCSGCHSDPHRTTVACQTCHTATRWKDVRQFDHSTTRFKLETSHRDLQCAQCHSSAGTSVAVSAKLAPVFAGTSMECASCHRHKEPHGGQFSRTPNPEDCSNCHVTKEWKTLSFDHNRARFTMDAAHRKVECSKCHVEPKLKTRAPAGKAVRIYRDTPSECVKCH
jgi:hypothetical protein